MSESTPSPSTGAGQVRDLIAEALENGFAGFASFSTTIYRARTYPLKADCFPAVLVYGYDETLTFLSISTGDLQGQNVCQMVVQIGTREADPEHAERMMEIMIGLARTAVLQSPALFGENGALERPLTVRTTRAIKAESDDVLAEATIIFELQWSETYTQLGSPACVDLEFAYQQST